MIDAKLEQIVLHVRNFIRQFSLCLHSLQIISMAASHSDGYASASVSATETPKLSYVCIFLNVCICICSFILVAFSFQFCGESIDNNKSNIYALLLLSLGC